MAFVLSKKLKKYFDVKKGVAIEDLLTLDPALFTIAGVASAFYDSWGCPFVFTSLTDGVHKSDTHKEGRGADIRIWGMLKENCQVLCDALNKQYGKDFGTGPEGCEELKVAILEEDHIHLQVRR